MINRSDTNMQTIYQKEDVVHTFVDHKIIKVIWHKLSVKQAVYDSCLAQLQEVRKGKVEVIIIDISHAKGTHPMEVHEWLREVLFPGYSGCPQFKGMVIIPSTSTITQMGTKRWKEVAESDQFGFKVYETDSLFSAENLAWEMMTSV